MCSYCGCQAITVIKLLTLQHEEIINKLGQVRRAAEKNDLAATQSFAYELANLLDPHSAFEEGGLFAALKLDDEFVEPLVKLTLEHKKIDGLVGRLIEG
ncbi:MAG TPA: hemerythrin domain-containing protein, partial [archaeon]|nr:hemerythrin domain-containing protein [archaeon]